MPSQTTATTGMAADMSASSPPDTKPAPAEAGGLAKAGYLLAEFLVSISGNRFREGDVVKALHGDISELYIWEQQAIEWLLLHRHQIPEINLWTLGLLKAVHERRSKSPY